MLAAVTALSLTPLASQGSSAGVGEPAVTGSAGPHSSVNLASSSRLAGVAIPVRLRSRCRSAREAVSYYRDTTHERQRLRGAALADRTPIVRGKSCRWARHAADTWKARARAAGVALDRWLYLFDYRSWMPAFWRAIAVCESGQNPPNWEHDSGTYVSTFGIIRGEYDDDAAVFGAPPWRVRHTPRDQYRAARGHQARFGLSGWGCYTHGGYRVHLGRV